MTLVDTNVLLDVATDDPKWARWSLRQLDAAAMRGPVVIDAIVYAEFSIGYTRIETQQNFFSVRVACCNLTVSPIAIGQGYN